MADSPKTRNLQVTTKDGTEAYIQVPEGMSDFDARKKASEQYPDVFAPPDTFFSETGKQLKSLGSGLKETLMGTAGSAGVSPGIPLISGMASMGKTMLRQLTGQPSEGGSALTAPQGVGRVFGAADAALGGDPYAAREHSLKGETGAAYADAFTVPLITLLTGGLLKKAPLKLPPLLKSSRGAVEYDPVSGKPEVTAGDQAKALSRAAGAGEGSKVNVPEKVQVALPDLQKARQQAGITGTTPKDYAKVVDQALSNTESEYNIHLQPLRGKFMDTTPIADALRNAAEEYDTPNPDTQQIRKYLLKKAKKFDPHEIAKAKDLSPEDPDYDPDAKHTKAWTVGTVDLERRAATGRLHGFMGKDPSGQMSVLRTNAEIKADNIIYNWTRDMVYSRMEEANPNLGSDYFRRLKQRQSAMIDITDQLGRELTKQGNAAAYDSLISRLRLHSYMSSGGHFGAAIGSLEQGFFPYKPEVDIARGFGDRTAPIRAYGLTSIVPLARQSQPSRSQQDLPPLTGHSGIE